MKQHSKYFKKRFLEQEKNVNKKAKIKEKVLKEIYKESAKELEKDLATFIQKYKKDKNFSLSDTKKFLNTEELARFKGDTKHYIEEIKKLGLDTEEGKKLLKEFDILAGRTRIARMEQLRTEISFELLKNSSQLQLEFDKHLKDTVVYAYDDTAEIFKANTIAKLDSEQIERIVNMKWNGKNYSSRIWTNKKGLGDKILKNIATGIVQGHDFRRMSRKLQEDMHTGYYESRRLIETETTFALERAKDECFKEIGIKQYRYIAEIDGRTSQVCKSLNGQVFDMKDRQIGVNCPPMHPFCRSVTVPEVSKKELKNIEKNSKIEEENFTLVEPEVFKETLTKTKKVLPRDIAWRVDVHEAKEYIPAKCYITKKGSTIAIKNGDIISVARHPQDKLRGVDIIEFAVKNGGIKLDSFEGNHGFYKKCGFEAVSWSKFNEEYAPNDWIKGQHEAEDVIFYKYTGNKVKFIDKKEIKTDLKRFKKSTEALEYDKAMELRDNEL